MRNIRDGRLQPRYISRVGPCAAAGEGGGGSAYNAKYMYSYEANSGPAMHLVRMTSYDITYFTAQLSRGYGRLGKNKRRSIFFVP